MENHLTILLIAVAVMELFQVCVRLFVDGFAFRKKLEDKVDDAKAELVAQFQQRLDNAKTDLTEKVQSNATAIAGIKSTVDGNATAITHLKGAVDGNANEIAGIKSTVDGNATAIAGLKRAVDGNADEIAGLKSTVDGNATEIATQKGALVTYFELSAASESRQAKAAGEAAKRLKGPNVHRP